jgi:hypothetical protein
MKREVNIRRVENMIVNNMRDLCRLSKIVDGGLMVEV